jgi:hypothetical protein
MSESMGKRDGVHRLLNGRSGAATDEQLVNALIEFANGREVELVRDGKSKELGGERAAMQMEFSELLALGAEDRAKLVRKFNFDVGMALLQSLRIDLSIHYGTRGMRLGYLRDFPTLRSALQYAVMLLLDLDLPYGSALCRCQLKRCGVFYLAARNPKGGPANRHYCNPEHRSEAHNLKQNRTPRKAK